MRLRHLIGICLAVCALLCCAWGKPAIAGPSNDSGFSDGVISKGCATQQCLAQLSLTGAGGKGSAVATFTGPGDLIPGASVYWSCVIAYTASYASGHGNACDMFRDSDAATCTSKFGSNGIVDTTVATSCAGATVTSFCGGTTCRYTKAYDQATANVNPGTAVSTFFPILTFGGVGSCPTTTHTAAGQQEFRNLTFNEAAPWTDIAIVRTTSSSGPADLGSSGNFTVNTSANTIQMAGLPSGITQSISQNTIYAAQAVSLVTGLNSLLVNGTTSTATASATATSAFQIGRAFDGDELLVGEWPIGFNSTQLGAMTALLRSYCGGF